LIIPLAAVFVAQWNTAI